MQNHFLKFIFILLFLSLFGTSATTAQHAGYYLETADSLFESKRYTQALKQYQKLIDNQQYTLSALLKMAYIHEATGNIAEAQYFLSLYFFASYNYSVLDKMEELANKHEIEGYTQTPQKKLYYLYCRYRPFITTILGILVLFTFVFLVSLKRSNQKTIPTFVILCVAIFFLVIHLQMAFYREVVVLQPRTYIMSAPSSGADVVEIVKAGHKFIVVGEHDVWIKVRWRNKPAYIKKNIAQPVVFL